MYTLYHYIHCPFCLRLRFAFGFLKVPYLSKVLSYEDEKTPIELTGTKMLPIVTTPEGKTLNESLDIIKLIDSSNKLKTQNRDFSQLNELLTKLGKNIHNLAMPYFIYTPEFSERARKYFQTKKEIKRGPFRELYKKREEFHFQLEQDLKNLEAQIGPYYRSQLFTIDDILLASHLWALYIVPEFQFSKKLHEYLQQIKKLTNFEYHEHSWL